MSLLGKVATTRFMAGVTMCWASWLGVTAAHVEPALGRELGTLAGAIAFAIGLVVVGWTDLFSENLFDPVAAAVAGGGKAVWGKLLWLWVSILALNLVGGRCCSQYCSWRLHCLTVPQEPW